MTTMKRRMENKKLTEWVSCHWSQVFDRDYTTHTSETKLRVVGQLQGLCLIAKRQHAEHWSENLLAPDLVAGRHFEHGRRDKETAARTRGGHGVAAAANEQLGAVGDGTCRGGF